MQSNIDKISTAVFLIFVGLIFLLGNLGIINFSDIFVLFFKFWAVLIVIGGVKLMIGVLPNGKLINLIFDIVVSILILLVLIFPNVMKINDGYFSSLTGYNKISTESYQSTIKVEDFPNVKIGSRAVDLNISGTSFKLKDDDSSNIFEVSGEYSANTFKPNLVSEMSGEDLKVVYKQDGDKGFSLIGMREYKSDFDFTIGNPNISTSLDLKLGAGEGDIKLDKLMLSDVDLNVGAGKIDMELNTLPSGDIDVSVGAGEVVITIPKETNLVINYNVGMGNVSIYEGSMLKKEFGGISAKGEYENTPTPTSSYILRVNGNVGVGSLRIILK